MIERYTRPPLAEIWSDEGRYRRWLAVEIAGYFLFSPFPAARRVIGPCIAALFRRSC